MKVSCVHSCNFGKTTSGLKKNFLTNTIQPKTAFKPHINKKFILPAFLAAVVSLFASTCSNTRGGNFVYNKETQKIEKFNKLDVNDMEYCGTNDYGLYGCHDKNHIKSIGVDKWIEQNQDKLNGSCYFMKDDNFVSQSIRLFTTQPGCCEYVPSHSTPIFKDEDGKFKLLQIMSPKVSIVDLADFLKNTKEDYVIFLRDFDINDERFVKNCKNEEGTEYGLFSAIQAVSNLINVDAGLHCSEGYVKLLQKEGYFKGIDANNITPNTLMYLLVNNHTNKK